MKATNQYIVQKKNWNSKVGGLATVNILLAIRGLAAFAISLMLTWCPVPGMAQQVTFNYVGSAQTWVVPNGVTSVAIEMRGAQGGGNGPSTPGGNGGRVQTTLAVTPGETLIIYVGGKGGDLIGPNTGGAGGWNGGGAGGIDNVDFNGPAGGGGGASDIRQGGGGLANRVVVAGGGGGAECCGDGNGGAGGGIVGASGGGTLGGAGGTQSAGGAGGCSSHSGSLGQGGVGCNGNRAGGGGGGGYYGGGGGRGSTFGAGGGGGSSYSTGSGTIHTQGYQVGNGQVIICPNLQITPFYQCEDRTQSFGFEPCNACLYGCALYSSASMLTAFGIPITPQQLDTRLKAVCGYTDNNECDGCQIVWSRIPDAVKNVAAIRFLTKERVTPPGAAVPWDAVDAYLSKHFCEQGAKLLLELIEYKNSNKIGTHFILLTGKDGDDWRVFDPGPWSAANSSLRGHLNGFIWNGNSYRFEFEPLSKDFNHVISFTAGSSPGALSVRVHSPVELTVRDPIGQRVGFDRLGGTNVVDIPGASYFAEFPIADDDGDSPPLGDPSGIRTVYIPSPLPGVFQFETYGTGTGTYTLAFETVWQNGGGQFSATTGTAEIGVTATNDFVLVVPPSITSIARTGNIVSLSFTTQPGATYYVETKLSLATTNWTLLRTAFGSGGIEQITATNAEATTFYRVNAQ